jgi:Fic family protein
MTNKPSGTYLDIRDSVLGFYEAFLPNQLPPEFKPDPALERLESLASHALGSLDAITDFLPDTNIFLYSYVRKEALLSSQIEGTQSSLSDLLLYESEAVPGVPINDVEEVSRYIEALNEGHQKLMGNKHLHQNIIQDLHHILLSSGRGSNKQPGTIRKTQNWVGGEKPGSALYVPPPAENLAALIENLFFYMNDKKADSTALRRAGIAHAQFETIHPFYDGNGRIGRMLISLMLTSEGLLRQPLLYLSLYFKQNRSEYYELLQKVREENAWNEWMIFFYRGVTEVAKGAQSTAKRLLTVFADDRRRIEKTSGRFSGTLLRIHEEFKEKISLRQKDIIQKLGISAPTASKAMKQLTQLGIIREITGKERYSIYAYQKYLDILGEGAEPL